MNHNEKRVERRRLKRIERAAGRVFLCAHCGKDVIPRGRQFSVQVIYCSSLCKMRAFTNKANITRTQQCKTCGKEFIGYQRSTCSKECLPKRTVTRVNRACELCGHLFPVNPSRSQKTCSRQCANTLIARSNKGKKRPARYIDRPCVDCGLPTPSARRVGRRCNRCVVKADYASRGGHTHCQRAKQKGVARDYSITGLKVFQRDGWRCQLCGCSTPKRLKGTCEPNAPEIDHIVPFACGGAHTWDNMQCACRRCNGAKATKPLGQQRLSLTTSAIDRYPNAGVPMR